MRRKYCEENCNTERPLDRMIRTARRTVMDKLIISTMIT
jgi:hypothetical protein